MDIDVATPTPLRTGRPGQRRYGALWFRGQGAQQRMFAHASEMGHQLYYSRQHQFILPEEGLISVFVYGSYLNSDTAWEHIVQVPRSEQNFFELMKEENPVKPFIDVDGDFVTSQEQQSILNRITKGIKTVAHKHYHIDVQDAHFQWSQSITVEKMSFHLTLHIILPDGKLACYQNNYQARHLINEIVKLDPDLAEYLDVSVYYRNRSLRTLGSTKLGKNANLMLFDNTQQIHPIESHKGFPWTRETFTKACITWLPPSDQLSFLPLPDKWVHGNAAYRAGRGRKDKTPNIMDPAHALFTDTKKSFVFNRIIEELLKHEPSLVIPKHPQFNDKGELRFKYTDRPGICLTGSGRSHEKYDIIAKVTNGEDIFVHCYSQHCPVHDVFLASLETDSVEWKQHAICKDLLKKVDQNFHQRLGLGLAW